jgi:uncharacterized ParB-like nuclease family protein
MNYISQLISLSEINPPHDVRDCEKFDALVSSMEADGWQGRPLLVIRKNGEFQAITGSHRYAAACEAGMEEVPCVVIDREKWNALHGKSTLPLQDQETCRPCLVDLEDPQVLALFDEEIARNEDEG